MKQRIAHGFKTNILEPEGVLRDRLPSDLIYLPNEQGEVPKTI